MNGGLERSPLRSPQPPRRSADLSQSALGYWNLRCGFAGPYRSKESFAEALHPGLGNEDEEIGGGCDRPPLTTSSTINSTRMPRCRDVGFPR